MNIKKIITCIMAILAAILVAITLTAENQEQNENEGEFEVGGSIPGVEIPIPEGQQ